MSPIKRGPVLIELDQMSEVSPSDAPEINDLPEQDAAMQRVIRMSVRPSSPLLRWFWSAVLALLSFIVSLAVWDYVNALVQRSPMLGAIAGALLTVILLGLLIWSLQEGAALVRIKRIDDLQKQAASSLTQGNIKTARVVIERLRVLYAPREDVRWNFVRLQEQAAEMLDADGVIDLAERTLMTSLDEQAKGEVEVAARRIATLTAIMPLPLVDVLAALSVNFSMIRRIAEIYGGRSGSIGSWRLTRLVLVHLATTGLVGVGDDLIDSVAGGGLVSKVSRRFGEGLINAALTARVGIAAMDVCRPLAFRVLERPSVRKLVSRALIGFFEKC